MSQACASARILGIISAAAIGALLASCAGSHSGTPQLLPRINSQTANANKQVRYRLIDLGTLGGPNSSIPEAFLELNGRTAVPAISTQGDAIAIADTAAVDKSGFFDDGFYPSAILYRDGSVTPLSGLPNGTSAPWSVANAISQNVLVAGASENGRTDPLTNLPELRAVVWRAGAITDLGTKGGYNSAAFAVNNAGEAAGYATNTTPDAFLGFQQKAARFDRGVVQDLPTLGGPDAIALLINERGQIAGISFTNAPVVANNPCAAGSQPWEPFLWDNGKLFDIGHFGGSCSMVNAMNDRGQVVGQSYETGDTIARAFLWQSGHLRDLGTLGGSNASAEAINDAGDIVGYADLPGGGCSGLLCIHHGFLLKNGAMTDLRPLAGDPCSRAVAINDKRQAVGASIRECGGADVPALLWENGGPPIDLNTVIAPGADMTLSIAFAINDRGIISGDGMLPNGDTHAFVLVPCTTNCAEVHLGETSVFHSSHALTEQLLNTQRTRVFGWHGSDRRPTLKE